MRLGTLTSPAQFPKCILMPIVHTSVQHQCIIWFVIRSHYHYGMSLSMALGGLLVRAEGLIIYLATQFDIKLTCCYVVVEYQPSWHQYCKFFNAILFRIFSSLCTYVLIGYIYIYIVTKPFQFVLFSPWNIFGIDLNYCIYISKRRVKILAFFVFAKKICKLTCTKQQQTLLKT